MNSREETKEKERDMTFDFGIKDYSIANDIQTKTKKRKAAQEQTQKKGKGKKKKGGRARAET